MKKKRRTTFLFDKSTERNIRTLTNFTRNYENERNLSYDARHKIKVKFV